MPIYPDAYFKFSREIIIHQWSTLESESVQFPRPVGHHKTQSFADIISIYVLHVTHMTAQTGHFLLMHARRQTLAGLRLVYLYTSILWSMSYWSSSNIAAPRQPPTQPPPPSPLTPLFASSRFSASDARALWSRTNAMSESALISPIQVCWAKQQTCTVLSINAKSNSPQSSFVSIHQWACIFAGKVSKYRCNIHKHCKRKARMSLDKVQ